MIAPDQFFCSEHASESDRALGGPSSVLAVSLALRVTLAGVSPMDAPAQTEAVELVVCALRGVGCRVNVDRVVSTMARIGQPAGQGSANPSADKG